ncbi:retinol-binding protein 5 isoform X1 [Rhinatrema bivittatum]|uniref:retinol-binding protein 5 isoform X1 n=1 Tax=Rhinatrema bivittatum TaxID=194408 RepID=UPI00112E38FA|nr:retinol-binding protein 5 isoform X1 [Rhinatrema bivittatum]
MPVDLTGTYACVSHENLDAYLKALDINVALRKVICLLKPQRELIQDGDHMIIKTLSTFKNYIMDFQIGVEFEEDLGAIDGRKCKTTVTWEGDVLVCVQRGEKKNRGWKHWLEDDLLYMEMTAEDAVSRQIFQKVK